MKQPEKSKFLEAFGSRVKQLRTEKGLSQEELANLVGYTSDNARSSINKIEAGKSDLPASKIRSLAKTLNVSISQLMGWDEEENIERIQTELDLAEIISKQYGNSVLETFNEYIELNPSEREKISMLLSKYKKMDEVDRAEVRGYIFSKIESILESEKYSAKDGLKNA